MNKEKITKSIIILLIPTAVISMFFVFALSNSLNDSSVQESQTVTETTPSTTGTQDESSQDVSQNEATYTNLAVDPDRCRGCGRCAAIDPEHFSMTGQIAEVISEKNLDSSSLNSAIRSCPADAIELS